MIIQSDSEYIDLLESLEGQVSSFLVRNLQGYNLAKNPQAGVPKRYLNRVLGWNQINSDSEAFFYMRNGCTVNS